MYIIGENIHIISQKVKDALREKDGRFFQDLAVRQVEAGADALDLAPEPKRLGAPRVYLVGGKLDARRAGVHRHDRTVHVHRSGSNRLGR